MFTSLRVKTRNSELNICHKLEYVLLLITFVATFCENYISPNKSDKRMEITKSYQIKKGEGLKKMTHFVYNKIVNGGPKLHHISKCGITRIKQEETYTSLSPILYGSA